MIRAGLNISSQDRDKASSTYQKHKAGSVLNKSVVSRSKRVDEWDNIIMNDVRRFEAEQREMAKKKQEMKQQIMSDLNAQMQEKKQLHKKEIELERELAQKREKVYEMQDKRQKQQELAKSRKHEEEKRNRESQIAEMENLKRLEKEKEKSQAVHDKEDIQKFLQSEIDRERKKREDYQQICKKQYQENMQLKEFMKQQEAQKQREDNMRKNDMFGDMFEVKQHVSYKYAAKNDQKLESLNKILVEEQERKNRMRNIAQFEEGLNNLEHKRSLEEQWKENRLKENLKMNRNYLEEQIKFKREQSKFEKDLELTQAELMNKKARLELEQESKKKENSRMNRVKHKQELYNQINVKKDVTHTMSEQERLLNKEKLDQINEQEL